MDILDSKIHDHLKRVRSNEIAEDDRASERLAVATAISDEWTSIINTFDNDRRGAESGILELYQKSLNIYKPPHDYNYIGNMRYYGWTIASIAVVLSLVMGVWVLKNRRKRIIRASQRECSSYAILEVQYAHLHGKMHLLSKPYSMILSARGN